MGPLERKEIIKGFAVGLLATLAGSMPQFGLLAIPVFIVMNLLSGSTTPLESMPVWLQNVMQFSPSVHYVSLSQAVLYRGDSTRQSRAGGWRRSEAERGLAVGERRAGAGAAGRGGRRLRQRA